MSEVGKLEASMSEVGKLEASMSEAGKLEASMSLPGSGESSETLGSSIPDMNMGHKHGTSKNFYPMAMASACVSDDLVNNNAGISTAQYNSTRLNGSTIDLKNARGGLYNKPGSPSSDETCTTLTLILTLILNQPGSPWSGKSIPDHRRLYMRNFSSSRPSSPSTNFTESLISEATPHRDPPSGNILRKVQEWHSVYQHRHRYTPNRPSPFPVFQKEAQVALLRHLPAHSSTVLPALDAVSNPVVDRGEQPHWVRQLQEWHEARYGTMDE